MCSPETSLLPRMQPRRRFVSVWSTGTTSRWELSHTAGAGQEEGFTDHGSRRRGGGGAAASVVSGLAQGSGEYFSKIGVWMPATPALMVLEAAT
jgi:hypothetical protein